MNTPITLQQCSENATGRQRVLCVILSLAIPFILLTALLLTRSGSPAQAQGMFIHFVAPGGDCGGANPCYATIQDAVNAAANGDIVKVAQGVYTSTAAQVVYIDRAVTLTGGYTITNWTTSYPITRPTVIDGQSARRGVSIDGTGITGVPTITLEGLTVRRGRFEYNGSGIYIRNGKVVLRQNQVLNNVAPYGYGGGGIYATGSIITLDSNTIQGNTATAGGYGGGISVDGIATLIGNKIQSNAAYSGGGIYVSGTAILSDNTIQGNSAGSGGGVALMGNATLNGNTIRGNTGDGGYVNGTITLSGNIIQGNSGDGVFVNGGTVNARNDIITGNGEGVHLSGGNLIARHWTLADNYRYAVVSNGGSAVLTNTIAYHHIMAAFYGPNITADHTLFYRNGAPVCQNGATCTNDVIGDPKFVNPAAGDYHIGPDSAAIDAGVNANVTDDIDGGPRPVGIGYDIGADEYDAEPPPPTGGPRYDPSMDVNKDGKIDVIDIQRVARLWGTSQWGTEQ